jgi:DDE superfamily endonuclease
MPDIMVLLACLSQCVEPTPLRPLGRVIEALLAMSGRVTMRGLSRWSGKGGSYRTIQRLFHASLNWCQLTWLLMRQHVLDTDDVVLMSCQLDTNIHLGRITAPNTVHRCEVAEMLKAPPHDFRAGAVAPTAPHKPAEWGDPDDRLAQRRRLRRWRRDPMEGAI